MIKVQITFLNINEYEQFKRNLDTFEDEYQSFRQPIDMEIVDDGSPKREGQHDDEGVQC